MDEYVDVFSDKWTKRLKYLAWFRFGIAVIWMIMCIITLLLLLEGLSPYIKGDEVWEEMPFTLSQLEAIMCLLVMCWLFKNSMKVF